MRSPSFYAPRGSRRTRPDRKHVSRSPDDTITCGLMLFIFIVLAATGRTWLRLHRIRPIDGHSFWRRLTWQNNPA